MEKTPTSSGEPDPTTVDPSVFTARMFAYASDQVYGLWLELDAQATTLIDIIEDADPDDDDRHEITARISERTRRARR